MTQPPAPTRDLLILFDELHQQRLGCKAHIVAGKDAKLMAQLWRRHGGDTVLDCLRDFFAHPDPFTIEAGFTVGVFASQFGKLLTRRAGLVAVPRSTSREGRNLAAAQRTLEALDHER